jgi:signal transduction histidine kinase
MLKRKFRDLIIGKHTYINSWVDYKNAILRGHLIVVSLLVGITYIFVDRYNNVEGNDPYYIAVIITAAITLIINRWGRYRLANILFLSLLNAIVFLFASNDGYRVGIYMFFVITGITSIALFGHKDRPLAFSFALLSTILFFLSYWGNFTILPKRVFTDEYVQISFATNFVIAIVTGIALLYFLIDVSHFTEKEILLKNELLGKTNKELDRFVYSASHDLRAPLRSLLGLIEISQKTDNPDDVKHCLELMKQRVDNMDYFIHEIIDFSRNARQEVRNEKVVLMPIVKEVIEDLKFGAGMDRIYVSIDIDPTFALVTDLARFKVVMHNLIGNAFKYHDPDKENSEVSIKASSENSFIRIDVKDNGLGIAEEHKSKIFEMFYRASERSQGSGLGLYIVQETLAKLNGSIQVKSEPGLGSIFSVHLPG